MYITLDMGTQLVKIVWYDIIIIAMESWYGKRRYLQKDSTETEG